jgi:hypothetical protein
MTGRVTSALRLRSLHVALLAALLLIIGGTHASADPSQQRAAASRVDWDAGKIRWGFGLVGAAAGSG